MTANEAFLAVVREWLTRRDATQYGDVVKVTGVATYGTDWAGDTYGGFYSDADVTVTFVRADGEEGHKEVKGEAMADLWDHVMRSWPAS